ncbi:MAG: hypothetical protein LBR61_12340 [Synergistaceae bacterium]|jgi:YbbR domain-containing protein|nr:hypothetical protein [Synergistaceae bacterium]
MNVPKKLDNILESPVVLWGISILVAVSMWFYVRDSEDSGLARRKFLCQLEYRETMPQILVKNTISQIEVEVGAPESVMNRLRHDSIVCELDLVGLSPGKYREEVKVTLPQNVTLYSVNPSEVDIELVRQTTRVFQVEVTLPRNIPSGQYLESVEVVPKEVHIKGTEKDLAKIGAVNIEPTFEELSGGQELLLPLTVSRSEPFDDEVVIEPQQVKMNATLVRGLPRKKVPVTVRMSGKPVGDYAVRSMTTEPAEVMLEGTQEKLNGISSIDTETVDITGVSADQTLVVPLRLPRGKDVKVIDVRSVKLQVSLESISTQKRFSNVPVAVEGAAGGKKWTVTPPVVDVVVEGTPSLVSSLDLNALGFRAWVNVSGIFLRSATLPVRASPVSEDLKSIRIIPATVSLTVVEE